MTTGRDICTQALKKCGVTGAGQVPEPEDINDAFADLRDMLAQWRVKRWFVFQQVDVSFNGTGAQSYTVGPGGNFNVTLRPSRLSAAYARQINVAGAQPVDYPLGILTAREDYSRISLKSLGTWPQVVFYDNGYPLGNAYFWPIPQAGIFELHLVFLAVLQDIAALDTVISLPPEYEAAMKWNLALRLRPSYQELEADPLLEKLAAEGIDTLTKANVQIPIAQIDPSLVRGGIYNIFSDQVN